MSSPPALLRSPLSGVQTTSRSPVSRIEEAPRDCFFARGFRFVAVEVAGVFDESELSAMWEGV
jgi:hypothetical protein